MNKQVHKNESQRLDTDYHGGARASDSPGLIAGLVIILMLIGLGVLVSRNTERTTPMAAAVKSSTLKVKSQELNQLDQVDQEATAMRLDAPGDFEGTEGDKVIESVDPIYPPAD